MAKIIYIVLALLIAAKAINSGYGVGTAIMELIPFSIGYWILVLLTRYYAKLGRSTIPPRDDTDKE